MTRALALGVVLGALSFLRAQDPPKAEATLTIEEVLAYANQGMTDEFIINQVKRNAKPFDLNSDEIVALRGLGISDAVISYLRNPSQPYAPPAPRSSAVSSSAPTPSAPVPPPPVVRSRPPSDPRVLKLPPDLGIYYVTPDEAFAALDFKAVVPSKQPGKMSSLSAGLVNGHIIGTLIDGKAKVRASGPSATFFFRLGEKTSIDDLALLTLDASSSQRDLDFGKKPGKPVFPVSSVKQFESKEIIAGVYRLTVPLGKPGEYLFFILGSGDEKKGQLGKGYDFGVDKPSKGSAKSGVNK
jgi:hypothetical protein